MLLDIVVGDGSKRLRDLVPGTTDNSHPNENGHAIIADNAVTKYQCRFKMFKPAVIMGARQSLSAARKSLSCD